MKIAFTTSNGIYIDSVFEKTKSFYVVEFENDLISSIRRRKMNKIKGEEIKYSKFEYRYERIKDCDIICTRKINFTAKLRLENLGIRVLVLEGKIKEALSILSLT